MHREQQQAPITAPRNGFATSTAIREFWPPWIDGLALGMILLLTFLMTGHGLGATGFTTRCAARIGEAPAAGC